MGDEGVRYATLIFFSPQFTLFSPVPRVYVVSPGSVKVRNPEVVQSSRSDSHCPSGEL